MDMSEEDGESESKKRQPCFDALIPQLSDQGELPVRVMVSVTNAADGKQPTTRDASFDVKLLPGKQRLLGPLLIVRQRWQACPTTWTTETSRQSTTMVLSTTRRGLRLMFACWTSTVTCPRFVVSSLCWRSLSASSGFRRRRHVVRRWCWTSRCRENQRWRCLVHKGDILQGNARLRVHPLHARVS